MSPPCPLHTENDPPYTTEYPRVAKDIITLFPHLVERGRRGKMFLHGLNFRARMGEKFRTGAFCCPAETGRRGEVLCAPQVGSGRELAAGGGGGIGRRAC